MINSKRILENAIAIFFAFLPMMILLGLMWFFLIVDAEQANNYLAKYHKTISDYLAEYQEIVLKQNSIISQQQDWIEIHRAQLSQLKPFRQK